jgi:putative methionine-R-sulfoxide reductase with GAF domain
MNSQRDLSALLDLIAREATSLLDCERASIFLLDRERNELWSKVALGSDEILRFDARRGIAGNTALTGNTINVRDAYSDPRFYNAIDDQTGYRTRTVLAVAVRNQHGEIIGAFETLNKRSGIFSARDEESLIALERRGISLKGFGAEGRKRDDGKLPVFHVYLGRQESAQLDQTEQRARAHAPIHRGFLREVPGRQSAGR